MSKTQIVKSVAAMRAETQLASINRQASLAARALARLETSRAEALAKSNGAASSVQMVAAAGDVTALIKAPGRVIEVQNGSFAVG
jgi:hypothetical protein